MREYVGTITRVGRETFTLTCDGPRGQKQLSARLISAASPTDVVVGNKVKIIGDWAGTLGAGALTIFTVREIEGLD